MGNKKQLLQKPVDEIEQRELRLFDQIFMRGTSSERLKSLPTPTEFRAKQQNFLSAPIGTIGFDAVAQRVLGGEIDYNNQPHLTLRKSVAEAFASAYASAIAIYIERDSRSARLKRVEALVAMRHSIDEFASQYDTEMLLLELMPVSVELPPDWTILDDARKFSAGLKSLETYFSDRNTDDTYAPAADVFNSHLADEMRKVWCEILGRKQKHGDGERIIDLTMAAGLDMGMFIVPNADTDLRDRIKKWFYKK